MNDSGFLGELELLVLSAVRSQGGGAYGLSVRDQLARDTGRRVSVGSVYATLGRLADKGMIRFELGEPTPTPGGRAKRYAVLLPAGERALWRTAEALARLAPELLRDTP